MKPVLSIGMIFKNEIRCLERCLKSLQPLRDAVPCQLVMADTGSDDGSREIAEKYADILFDFPWINDFAAARNAVMDRCSGEWYLSIDADEWLDDNLSQLTEFLSHREMWESSACGVMVRNYFELNLDGEYSDFLAVRMARLDTGLRYKGAIHEMFDHPAGIRFLVTTVLHHDGYVESIKKERGKLARNMDLLREKLAQDPGNLNTLLQCIESSRGGAGHEDYIRQAVTAVERRLPLWQYYGQPILRYAILWASGTEAPELERWAAEMEEWFPDSVYTNIDMAYALFMVHMEKWEYDQAILMGERYLSCMAKYRAGEFDHSALTASSLVMANELREEGVRAILAEAYFQAGQPEKAWEMLLTIDPAKIRPGPVGSWIKIMMNLHAQGTEGLSSVLEDFWEKNGPEKKRGAECRQAMAAAAEAAFSEVSRAAEDEQGFRHAYTLFLPLAGKCEVGNAAKLLASQTPWDLTAALEAVEDWTALPIPALLHAIENGVLFPLSERPLNLETMDNLAARLSGDPNWLEAALDRTSGNTDTPQSVAWAARLALAAVQGSKWEDEARGMALARTFAELEAKFLPLCYAVDAPFFLLPPLHRFGYCCAQAFRSLDSGDPAGYVRYLRQGLETCPSMKPMAEFLLDHTPELRAPPPDPELLALAERVRTLLASFPEGDPSVAALKTSPAYQRVAHLIEEGGV